MKGKLYLLIVLSLLLFACNPESYIDKRNNLTILHLFGSPYERGFDHGKLLKPQIDSIIKRWMIEVENTYHQDFEGAIEVFSNNTTFRDTVGRYHQEIIEEIEGIADGSGQAYETMLAFQMSEEIEAFAEELAEGHCTAISVNKTDTTPTILAQNMDPPPWMHGAPTLLHIYDDDKELYVYTVPGFIGLDGMNSKGIGIAFNGISMLSHSREGLPVSFIVRGVLDCTSEAAAYRYIEQVPIGVPQCFTIGGPKEARCYECSPNEKQIFYPFDEKNISFHTNFSLANRDFNQYYIDLLAEYGRTVDDPYFCPRYFLLYDKIEECDRQLNAVMIKELLSLTVPEIHPISNNNTYGCLVMGLSEHPVLHIAAGKPNETEFIRLSFDE
ncbi:MAG: C45 family peptidase [Bacteroidales bacterium]|nr:C45 family peptidase [Bacteroidales bacterium]MCF8345213.1 C45 family peptidase [Bacteroidales bacterium]MCF8351850.1 C45 family peptidase [Bacteroidales bacterium]MCF8375269.1 C45 family peptidase [Bacteroidales bacterium]MCF8401257.1 C45 family peptidase [Bacteroidales bacterium]